MVLLVGTAVLYCFNLRLNGWGNTFYAAAAQAGSLSWKALLYGASDPAASITVDKPPAALWVLGLSVRALGLNPIGMFLPQVLMGVGTVALVHASARRLFGAGAGLLAGLIVALTPVALLMFRYNNPDALLVLLMTAAGYCVLRACEQARARWLIAAAVLLALGFLTKMLQVGLVAAPVGLVYLVAAPTGLGRRIVHLLGAGLAAAVSLGWYVALVALTPASQRPWIGGSPSNSFLQLALGYNGIGRLTGQENGRMVQHPANLARLLAPATSGQIAWLLPLALMLLVIGLVRHARGPRTDLVRAYFLFWGCWLVTTVVVFSSMTGIFNRYYTVALVPAIATVVAAGLTQAWRARNERWGRLTLAASTFVTSAMASSIMLVNSAYPIVISLAILLAGILATLLVWRLDGPADTAGSASTTLRHRAVAGMAVAVALVGPLCFDVLTLVTPHNGAVVVAGPVTPTLPDAQIAGYLGSPATNNGFDPELISLVSQAPVGSSAPGAHDSTSWAAAMIGSRAAAAPLQLACGRGVMPIGGFSGSDPSPSLAQFRTDVEAGRITYFISTTRPHRGGWSRPAQEIYAWVHANYPSRRLGRDDVYLLTAAAQP